MCVSGRQRPKQGDGEDGETEDEKTEDGGATTEGESVAGDLTDGTNDAHSDHELIESEPAAEPEPEPQPPSPAPEGDDGRYSCDVLWLGVGAGWNGGWASHPCDDESEPIVGRTATL